MEGLTQLPAHQRALVQPAPDAMDRAPASVVAAGARPAGSGPTREVWRSYGPAASSQDLYRLLRRWDRYRTELLGFMAAYDAVLCPVSPCPAPPHGATSHPELEHALSYTTPWSMAGWRPPPA